MYPSKNLLSENIIDFLFTLLDQLLLVPSASQLLCHLVALEGLKLGLPRRQRHVSLDQLLPGAQLVFPVLLAPGDYVPHLTVQSLLDLAVDLFGPFSFFDRPRPRLDRPNRGWIFDDGVLPLQLVFLIAFLHLLLPVLPILLLGLFFLLEVALLFLIKLPYLVLKLLSLAHKHVYFLRQTVLDDLDLIFLRALFDWILFQQSESVHAHV